VQDASSVSRAGVSGCTRASPATSTPPLRDVIKKKRRPTDRRHRVVRLERVSYAPLLSCHDRSAGRTDKVRPALPIATQ
jgi:hypothetical protein